MAAAPVLGGDSGFALSQTWPSRTPTPSGPQPSPNPPGTEPPPEQTATATVEPGSRPPATQPPGPGPGEGSPSSGTDGQLEPGSELLRLPAAAEVGDCGLPPIAVARGPVNVRSGPGIEFDSVDQLQFNEERVIVGRAVMAAWWQILLPFEGTGWVSDQAVAVVGYIGAVPLVAEDQAEIDAPQWNPTPNPDCTPPSSEEITSNVAQVATAILAERPTAAASATPAPQSNRSGENANSSLDLSPPSSGDGASGLSLVWLPIVGVFLMIAGGVALLFQRRQS